MALKARIEIESRGRTFASGLLLDIVAALRETAGGDLVAITGDDPAVGKDLETWSRLTRNPIVDVTSEDGRTRWVFCCVRSSPTAARRELGLDLIRRIVSQARALGLEQLFVTGGEPFLLSD